MSDALASALLLFGSLEQKLFHLSDGQTLREIKKRAVLFSLMAAAIGLAALAVTFDEGSAHQIGVNGDLTEQGGLALAQRQSGTASGGKRKCSRLWDVCDSS